METMVHKILIGMIILSVLVLFRMILSHSVKLGIVFILGIVLMMGNFIEYFKDISYLILIQIFIGFNILKMWLIGDTLQEHK